MWRSSDGKMRFDTPHTSVISDPASQQAVLLDHVKKEATILPMPPGMAGAASPGAPQAPAGAVPTAPPMHVEDLGKSMIEGHEVQGRRFTLPAVVLPAKPQVPRASMPGAPPMPKSPASNPPQAPKMPPIPNVTEVWSSVKLKTPVLTKVTTSAGEQTTYCKPTSTEEPHPSVFQIPQGYKIKTKL
jgi:hypothetical protein